MTEANATHTGGMHAAAQRLARLGLKPHYLAPPQSGVKKSGKAPLDPGWQHAPYVADPAAPVREGVNLGLRTGRVEGAPLSVVVVDLDSAEAVTWARENLPATPMRTITASGEHWYYRAPDASVKVSNAVRLTLPSGEKLAIDVRGDGGNVVVAPSVHASGHVYTEAEPWDSINPGSIPVYTPLDGRKLGARARKAAPAPAQGSPGDGEGGAFDALDSLPGEPPSERPGVLPEHFATRLHNACAKGGGGAAAIAALRAMAAGDNYAPSGERNATLFQAIRLLAEWFPEATDAQLEDFARESVIKTGDRAPERELENFRTVLQRAREKFATRDRVLLRLSAHAIRITPAHIGAGDIRERLFVMTNSGHVFPMREEGGYEVRPWKPDNIRPLLNHPNILKWAVDAGLARFEHPDEKTGRNVLDSWQSIAKHHVYPVTAWRGDFNATESHVEGRTFVEAVAPRRWDLTPCEDAKVHAWLMLLGGDRAELLLDWLATFPRLEEPTPALVLVGAKSAGKNLLVEGLAKLWQHGTPTPFDTTGKDFNPAMMQCPLLFADEHLPRDARGRVTIDEQLRQLVTARSYQINRKYLDEVTVHGCLRIVVATNQDNFDFSMMTEESKSALAERILHIDVGPAPRDYLEALGGKRATATWARKGDAIARHVLWLQETRKVEEGSRLLVDGNGRELIDRASNSRGVSADLSTWLCGYLTDPRGASIGTAADGIIAGDGEVWVSPHLAFVSEEVWRRFVRHSRAELPSVAVLGAALAGLSGGVKTQKKAPGEPRPGKPERPQYYKIDVAALLSWAERYGMDCSAIRKTIGLAPSSPPAPVSSVPAPRVAPRPAPAPTAFDAFVAEQMQSPTFKEAYDEARAELQREASSTTSEQSEAKPRATPERSEGKKPRAKRGEAAAAKAAAKRGEDRGESFYTPTNCPWSNELLAKSPATEQAAVEAFKPWLQQAMDKAFAPVGAEPQTYARLVNAYRGYRAALRAGESPTTAHTIALDYWFDRRQPNWTATTGVPRE